MMISTLLHEIGVYPASFWIRLWLFENSKKIPKIKKNLERIQIIFNGDAINPPTNEHPKKLNLKTYIFAFATMSANSKGRKECVVSGVLF